jgi:DNA polymerase-3 subunit gamma/tau
LLKTLEEPPPHAKFLLATTDPQKLPVTILSRCLQFNLKSLTIEQIERQLSTILDAETIPFENSALKPLAIAADGSMRDALSLLDQAIAYSNAKPNLADVEAMLGSVQKDRIFDLLNALVQEDGLALIEQSRALFSQGIDANTILAELINALQRIALSQVVPDAIDDSFGDKQKIEQVAQCMAQEDVQLYYQIALNGRKDLPYSPQPQGGFEMILLRMLAFKPLSPKQSSSKETAPKNTPPNNKSMPDKVANSKGKTDAHQVAESANNKPYQAQETSLIRKEKKTLLSTATQNSSEKVIPQIENIIDEPMFGNEELPPIDAYVQENFQEPSSFQEQTPEVVNISSKQSADTLDENSGIDKSQASAKVIPLFNNSSSAGTQSGCENSTELADYWHDLIKQSMLTGLEQQLAKHCVLLNKLEHSAGENKKSDCIFELLLDPVHKHLLSDKINRRLLDVLQKQLNINIQINIKIGQNNLTLDTPRRRELYEAEVLQQQAIESIYADEGVQKIVTAFGATIHKESIKPL